MSRERRSVSCDIRKYGNDLHFPPHSLYKFPTFENTERKTSRTIRGEINVTARERTVRVGEEKCVYIVD